MKLLLFTSLAFSFLSSFLGFTNDLDMSLSKEQVLIGEPVTLTISIPSPDAKKITTHKLIINGKDFFENNPYCQFFIDNSIEKKSGGVRVVSYELPLFSYGNGDFVFEKEGDFKILLQLGDTSIEKEIKVHGVPEKDMMAFSDYKLLVKNHGQFLNLIFSEFDKQCFDKAMEMVTNHSGSLYSKLPAIYCSNMRLNMLKSTIITEQGLNVGDKIDMKKARKYELEVVNKNLSLLMGYDFKEGGFVGESWKMSILRNKLKRISAIQEIPQALELADIKNMIDSVEKECYVKKNMKEIKEFKASIEELNNKEN